jgi:hypothetical protein
VVGGVYWTLDGIQNCSRYLSASIATTHWRQLLLLVSSQLVTLLFVVFVEQMPTQGLVGINNSYVTQMILGGINFGTTFIGLYVVQHLGGCKSLIIGAFWKFITSWYLPRWYTSCSTAMILKPPRVLTKR